VRGGLHVDIVERGVLEELAVGGAVERDAARQAHGLHFRSVVNLVEEREVVLFQNDLHGSGHVGVLREDFGARNARLAEHLYHLVRVHRAQGRLAAFPGHLDAVRVVREVVEFSST
jgi:hypothetical protein